MKDNDNEMIIWGIVDAVNPVSSVNYVLDIISDKGIIDLNRQIINCKNCSICNTVKSVVKCKVKPGRILVLSEHVTKEQLESSSETAFMPYEGTNFATILEDKLYSLFSEDALFFSDVVHCYPYHGKNYAQRPPTSKEISSCLPFLWELVRFMRPIAIMAMGNIVINALLPGQFIADRDHGRWTMVRDIPTMIFQNPADIFAEELEESFDKDLELFVNSLRSNESTKVLLRG